MTGDSWRRLAADVEQLDVRAGRVLHAALARHAAPLRVQVAGRRGCGHDVVERAVVPSAGLAGAVVTSAIVDRADAPAGHAEPRLDADLVVYVVPARLDPVAVHPADRAALGRLDPRRVILVVPLTVTPVERATLAARLGVPADRAVADVSDEVIAERVAVALRLRDEQLFRAAAGIAASPAARDLIERALDTAGRDVATGPDAR